jgi:thioredoxin reductase (NADPH)
MNREYDIVIVGAGPAGLSAAIYTGRGRLKTLVLEKGLAGGQILLTDWIENYPGFPDGIVPFQLMQDFQKQAERFGAEIAADEVRELKPFKGGWKIVGREAEYLTRSLIIATGSAYRKLGIKGESELTGRGVSYCATCDAAFFQNKDVGIVGGGDNALTEALFLTKFCRSVKLIHRRDQLRGEKILQERVFANEKITILWDTVVTEISGGDRLSDILLKNVKSGKQEELALDGLFIAIGTQPNSEFVQRLLDLDEWGSIVVQKNMETSRTGIFAAGDATDACPKQMATAVGTGVHAALSAMDYLDSLS